MPDFQLKVLMEKSRLNPTKQQRRACSSPIHLHRPLASKLCTFGDLRMSDTRYNFPEQGISSHAAYQYIADEMVADGDVRHNLATYTTTWMEPESDRLIEESLAKNFSELSKYPITAKLHDRCVHMIAHLYHAPLVGEERAVGTSCVGSSEAGMLAGLAFKRKWQNKRKAQGKPFDKPNIVMGTNVQVCWKKFACYFEVEHKEVHLTDGVHVMDPQKAVELVDENTICVCVVLGSTLNGEFEDVQALNNLLVSKNAATGWDVGIHVDAAGGGFVAPFLFPDLQWDFRLPLVKSINVSGHKYGLVYPGIGWVVWRSGKDLPKDLVFHLDYLGSDQASFSLNFSKGVSHIIAQYYQFIRLGFEGYRRVIEGCRRRAEAVKEGLMKTGRFEIQSKEVAMPVVAFALKEAFEFDEFDLSAQLRLKGWDVPAYRMASHCQHVKLLRVVIRSDFDWALCADLLRDLTLCLHLLDQHPEIA